MLLSHAAPVSVHSLTRLHSRHAFQHTLPCTQHCTQLYLRQFNCAGLWRSEVLGVAIATVPQAYRHAGTASDSVTLTLGDPWQGGAVTQLTFPYQPG